jgi:hypothetical protein
MTRSSRPPSVRPGPRLHRGRDADDTFAALDAQLATFHNALKQLLDVSCDKLAAIRRADTQALRGCAIREEELLREVLFGEQQRGAVLARVAQHLHCDNLEQHALAEIAARAPEPWGSVLQAKTLALRKTAEELQRKNGVVRDVAQNLQSHIRSIFANVAKAAQETVVYGAQGQHEASETRSWVDAVG